MRELQNVKKKMLETFAKVCEEHELTYFIYCWTLLGAVRHKGFIPWDDRTDVAMPLQDYEQLIKLADRFPEGYTLQHPGNTEGYSLAWAKLYANGTTYMEQGKLHMDTDGHYKMHQGVSMDIYPVIGAAGTAPGRRAQRLLLDLTGHLLAAEQHIALRDAENRKQRALMAIPYPLRATMAGLCLRLAIRDPKKCRAAGSIDAAPFEGKFRREELEELTELEFQGRRYPAPAQYDQVLRRMYGDYRKLPSVFSLVDDRPGEGMIIDTRRDYRDHIRQAKKGAAAAADDETEELPFALGQKLEQDLSVEETTGRLKLCGGSCVNLLPVHAPAGTVIRPCREELPFRCFFYSPEVDGRLMYTPCYDPEANWTTYEPGRTETAAHAGTRHIKDECYLRIVVREEELPRDARFADVFELAADEMSEEVPEWMEDEVGALEQRVRRVQCEDSAVFFLLADSHFAAGSNWEDTVRSMKLAAGRLRPQAVIHLGDFTDGILPARCGKGIAKDMLRDLRAVCGRTHVCVGNHDLNNFGEDRRAMTPAEAAELYRGTAELCECVDLPEQRVRMLLLDSYDPAAKEKYGFDRGAIRWVKQSLDELPPQWRVLVFSHVPPLAEIHTWSDTIRGGERLMNMLEKFHRSRGGAVLGWIYGHNHADQIVTYRAFPVIGICCSKTECIREQKPAGGIQPGRERGTATQELWDALVIHPANGGLDLIRFGAGEDRHREGILG